MTPLPATGLDGELHFCTGPEDATGLAHVFAVVPDEVLVFGKGEPFTQTRYRFWETVACGA